MPEAKIIHLATHGLLDYLKIFLGLPGGGAVALAPSGEDNGLLTTEEILNLKLNAELVVLSACDTGNGKITGDGVIGLSRSLITAGVPSVIASLWSVPDAPTAFLMTQFYKNLQQNPDKAQALRSAMLTTTVALATITERRRGSPLGKLACIASEEILYPEIARARGRVAPSRRASRRRVLHARAARRGRAAPGARATAAAPATA